MARRCGTREVLVDVHIQNRLEIVEPSILNDTEHSDECVEDQVVHIPFFINMSDKDRKQRVENIPKEFDNFDLTNERELGEDSAQFLLVRKLLPMEQTEQLRILRDLGRTEKRTNGETVGTRHSRACKVLRDREQFRSLSCREDRGGTIICLRSKPTVLVRPVKHKSMTPILQKRAIIGEQWQICKSKRPLAGI